MRTVAGAMLAPRRLQPRSSGADDFDFMRALVHVVWPESRQREREPYHSPSPSLAKIRRERSRGKHAPVREVTAMLRPSAHVGFTGSIFQRALRRVVDGRRERRRCQRLRPQSGGRCRFAHRTGRSHRPTTSLRRWAVRGDPCRDDRYCPPSAHCIDHACVESSGDCQRDDDCRGDTRCLRGACVAYDACVQLEPFRRACRQARFVGDAPLPPPEVRCQVTDWNSTSLPVVADLDGDGRPEVVTQTFPSALLAVHGDTCEPLFRKQIALRSDGMGSLAVADLDSDGHPGS